MLYPFNAGEVFKIAVEIEENGRRFYEMAAKKSQDPEVRKVFADLGAEEVKHKARFEQLLSELPASATDATVWDPDNEIDQYLQMMADMHIFRLPEYVDELFEEIEDEEGALQLAIQFEKDSIIFFVEMQTLAENDQSREKINWLVKEEQAHLRRLSLELYNLPV